MPRELIQFSTGTRFTLGVEIEFQILDQSSFSLVPYGPLLHEQAPAILQSRISKEFIKSILEIQTDVCRDVRDVENDLLQTCTLAEELAAENGCLLWAASLHPFALAEEQELSNDVRYERIMDELQIVGRRFISQGLHIHVGVPDDDSVVRVCNSIQAFLPLFLALSASSPFYQGKDTGLMSFRTKLFEALPLAGGYEYMRNWQHFNEEVSVLQKHGIIGTIRDLWWDARPSPDLGTIEVRICDLPVRFSDILAIVSFIQATVAWIVEEDIRTGPLNNYILKANKWQALRHGLQGRFVDPTGLLVGQATNIASAILRLKSQVNQYAEELGALSYLDCVEQIIKKGTGADMQRQVFSRTKDFREVVKSCHQVFWR